jgi:hypothetical protein
MVQSAIFAFMTRNAREKSKIGTDSYFTGIESAFFAALP